MFTLISHLAAARRFARDDSGATAIEYGVIAGLIAVGLITALVTLGPQIAAQFTEVGEALTAGASE